MKAAAVIPAYNEEKTIGEVIRRTKRHVRVVIVVDDGSRDKTAQIARKSGAILIQNGENRGVGYTKRRGLSEAIKRGADIIITLDADLQHRPEDIPRFVEKVEEGYDLVLGTRDISKYPFIKKFGNFGLNILTNLISGTNFRLMDTESGYKAFSRSGAEKLDLRAERYAIEAEIAYEAGKNHLRCVSIPIESPVYRKGVTLM
ncbi:MAG: glycosyltransferase family 2 protein, partial [Candidatus Aenigmatarchaeota archaeon]